MLTKAEIEVLVNDKYLEYFDNPTVKIKDSISPVLIYEMIS